MVKSFPEEKVQRHKINYTLPNISAIKFPDLYFIFCFCNDFIVNPAQS